MESELRYFAGIDPGANGAICIIDSMGRIVSSHAFPQIKNKLDVHGLKNLLMDSVSGVSHVYLEDVHAIYGSAAGATFSFGWCCGLIEGILTASKTPFTMITPKDWQKQMWRGVDNIKVPSKTGKKMVNDTKAMSLLAARRLFPNESFLASVRCSKPHDGIVDATLIAECCRRSIK